MHKPEANHESLRDQSNGRGMFIDVMRQRIRGGEESSDDDEAQSWMSGD
jgi:hypothetical protein